MTKRLNFTQKNKVQRHFYSVKNRSFMYVDSKLERDIACIFEFNKDIERYCTQPFSTYYEEGGKTRRYTPDNGVREKCTLPYLVEVKRKEQSIGCAFENKFGILQRHLWKRHGCKLKLYTNESFTVGRFANTQNLYRYIAQPLNLEEQNFLCSLDPNLSCFGELQSQTESAGLPVQSAFKMVAHQELSWNMDKLLSNETILEVLR
jgi:hypothetical protein